jgi:hypothetical protein
VKYFIFKGEWQVGCDDYDESARMFYEIEETKSIGCRQNLKPFCLPCFMSLKKGAEEGKRGIFDKIGYKVNLSGVITSVNIH